MKSLFEAEAVAEVKARMNKLRPESERLWGKMSAAQALAHCSVTMETALGEKTPPRSPIGRVVGPLVRTAFFGDKPFGKNAPTDKSFVVKDDRDLAAERQRLAELIDRFAQGGPAGCTKDPHCFFGKFTAEEWGMGMYKHLDHHLRQFGA